jgi:hypothetical protein
VGDRAHGAVSRRPPIPLYTMVPLGRWGLGFVHRSRTILCRAVPNPLRHDSQTLCIAAPPHLEELPAEVRLHEAAREVALAVQRHQRAAERAVHGRERL